MCFSTNHLAGQLPQVPLLRVTCKNYNTDTGIERRLSRVTSVALRWLRDNQYYIELNSKEEMSSLLELGWEEAD
jgi:hypothetical protein